MPATLRGVGRRRLPTLVTLRVTVCVPARSPIAIDAHVQVARVDTGMHGRSSTTPAAACRTGSRASRRSRSRTPGPGRPPLFGCTWPAPWRKITSGLVFGAACRRARRRPVVISADLIAIGDQSGCSCLNSAAEAGHVRARHRGAAVQVEAAAAVARRRDAARMSCPGAIRSGFSRSPPPASSGPRDEKHAVSGAGAL